jgi:rhamnosyltransferase
MIYLIIVLYYPNDYQIFHIVEVCKNNNCIIIDNTPNQENDLLKAISSKEENQIIYIPLKTNMGIATAHNIAIEEAKNNGAEYILLLDQDSSISSDFAQELLREYKKISFSDTKIAAIGPLILNEYTGKLYKTDDNKKDIDSCETPSALISSGMLVNIQTFNDVGGMDEDLFIDYVDFEWCWRARSKGYTCYRTKNLVMPHRVGLGDKKIFNYVILTSAPIRYYYQYRNFLKLCHRDYVPTNWKIKEFIKRIFFLIYIPLVSGQKKLIWFNMFKGIKDGIL